MISGPAYCIIATAHAGGRLLGSVSANHIRDTELGVVCLCVHLSVTKTSIDEVQGEIANILK
jgi:hypothetical protein